MTKSNTALKIAGFAGLAALLWGTLIERQLFTVRSHTLPVLQRGSHPLRVLHLSDLHLAPWQTRKMRWVRSLRHLNPDVVVVTGDFMGHVEALPMLRHTLETLKGIPGVFVFGSNDYYGPILKNPLKYLMSPSRLSTREKDIDNEALTNFLETEMNWVSLNNRAALFDTRAGAVEFFGMNDPHIRYDDEAAMLDSLRALRKKEKEAPTTRLGVVHAPYRSALDALLEADAKLIFAGHTHGGQVCIPGYGALTTNCDLPTRQAKGLSVWFSKARAAFLNVSAGLGHSIYSPIRFACRPEASLITLTAPR